MGETKVAEGPLIRHVPGGYAEWQQKESGLPPARLRSSEGEWWGRLVAGDKPQGIGGIDTGVDTGIDTGVGTGDTGEGGGTVVSPAPDTYEDFYGIKQDWDDPNLYWKDVDPKSLHDPNYKGVKTGDASPEIPEAYGWGWSYDDKGNIIPEIPSPPPREYVDKPTTLEKWGGYRDVGKPPPTITLPGRDPRTQEPVGEKPVGEQPPTKPLEASTYEDWMGFRYYSNPDNQNLIVGAVKDITVTLKDIITKLVGPTGSDVRGKTESENVLIKAVKDFLELTGAYREEVGGPIAGGLLWETEGGKTRASSEGLKEQPHFPNIPKTLLNFIQRKEDPIVMQKYGDYHWIAILTYALAAQQYGPVAWTIGGIRSGVPTIMDAINGMFMEHPNLEGNVPQDIAHVAAWILGRSTLKMWEITGGKILEKLGREPKPKSGDETILQKFEVGLTKSIGELGGMFTGKEPKGKEPEGEQRKLGPSIKYTPTPSPHLMPPERPRTVDPRDLKEYKGEVTKKPLLDIADAIAGEIVGEKPKGESTTHALPPSGIGGDKRRELEQEQEERERLKLGEKPPIGGETGETGDDEKGKGLDQPLHLWLPVDNWGSQYGDTEFDEDNIVGIQYRPHWPKEGEGEEFEREANRLGDQWTAEQGTGDEKPDDPTKDPDPLDNRLDSEKRLGLASGGNSWQGDEWRDMEVAAAIRNAGVWEDSHVIGKQFNNQLPRSSDTNHPNYEGHFPDHWSNPSSSFGGGGTTKRDTPILNWDAGLQQGFSKTITEFDIEGRPVEMRVNYSLQTESYPDVSKPSGWGYRYRYVREDKPWEYAPWEEWTPGP